MAMKEEMGGAKVPERVPMDRFENAIREIGVVAACEWFGHAADSEFTAETIRLLNERSPAGNIERKVYQRTAEHAEYLRARFAVPGARSFDWEGHRWAYRVTAFDDAGDYDLIWRPAATGSAA